MPCLPERSSRFMRSRWGMGSSTATEENGWFLQLDFVETKWHTGEFVPVLSQESNAPGPPGLTRLGFPGR